MFIMREQNPYHSPLENGEQRIEHIGVSMVKIGSENEQS